MLKRPKRFQRPLVHIAGNAVAKDVEVAIASPDFKELGIGAVPLIDDFLNHIVLPIKLKPNWALISLAARIAFHSEFHFPLHHRTKIF